MIWMFAALIAGIIYWEVPALIKEKSYRELTVFTVLLIAGIYLGLVQLYELPFYNPIPELVLIIESK